MDKQIENDLCALPITDFDYDELEMELTGKNMELPPPKLQEEITILKYLLEKLSFQVQQLIDINNKKN